MMSETGPAYDLIVVGAGGMTTVLCAAHLGLKVLLCEASDQVSGTTVFSAGTFWIPGNHPSRLTGMLDTVDEARRYRNAVVGPQELRGLREALFEIGAAAMEFLHRHTQVRFVPAGLHPDYLQREGAATPGGGAGALRRQALPHAKPLPGRAGTGAFLSISHLASGRWQQHWTGHRRRWTRARLCRPCHRRSVRSGQRHGLSHARDLPGARHHSGALRNLRQSVCLFRGFAVRSLIARDTACSLPI